MPTQNDPLCLNICRYLDRSYWEQQSQQKQTFQQKQDQGVSDLGSTLSPTQPSAPINATKASLSPTKLSQVKMTEVSLPGLLFIISIIVVLCQILLSILLLYVTIVNIKMQDYLVSVSQGLMKYSEIV